MPNCSWSSFLNCNVDFTCVAKRLAGSFNVVQREMTAEGLRSRGAEGNPDRLRPQLLCSPALLLLCRHFPALEVRGDLDLHVRGRNCDRAVERSPALEALDELRALILRDSLEVKS